MREITLCQKRSNWSKSYWEFYTLLLNNSSSYKQIKKKKPTSLEKGQIEKHVAIILSTDGFYKPATQILHKLGLSNAESN